MISQKTTKHKEIEEYIIQYIKERNLQPGDRLPAEREIGTHFGVSQFPVRTATENLVERGVLVRKKGKGKFVNQRLGNPVYTTNKLGVLYTPLNTNFYRTPFYTGIAAGIKYQAEQEGKSLVFRSLHDYYRNQDTRDAIKDILQGVDGLLIIEMEYETRDDITKQIELSGKPIVTLASIGMPGTVDSIEFGHSQNVADMARFLMDKGHKRIALCVPETNRKLRNDLAELQVSAFNNTLAAGDTGTVPSVHYIDTTDEDKAFREYKDLMARPDRPTAIFCNYDGYAHLIFRYARKLGIRIPEDLTVVGYDDIPGSALAEPPLTTISLPLFEMGEMGMQRLLEKLREKKEGKERVFRTVLPGTIVERESHKDVKSQSS